MKDIYNGIFGNQPTNNISIEVQLMSRFMKDNMHLDLLNRLQSSSAPFNEFFSDSVVQHARYFSTIGSEASCDKGFSDPPKHTLTVLPIERIRVHKSSFSLLYPDIVDFLRTTLMPATAKKFTYMKLNGVKLSYFDDKSANPFVFATPLFPFSTHSDISPRLAEIQFFIRYSFEIQYDCGNKHILHIFAVVDWPQVHPVKDSIGEPVQVWCQKLYENALNNSYVPIENIVSRIICALNTF